MSAVPRQLPPPPSLLLSFMTAVLSKCTVTGVGLICKAFLNSGLCTLQLNGLHHIVQALEGADRNPKQGIVTVCNHISTLDDPVIWGVLPPRFYLNSRTTRWALGASEIMFTNPIFSAFFRLGQTLETFRGKGIYQEAVNTAIQKIDDGHWVHLYGEGKVNRPKNYPRDSHGRASLPRFKWGASVLTFFGTIAHRGLSLHLSEFVAFALLEIHHVFLSVAHGRHYYPYKGRIVMEAQVTPKVIPMWISGFEQLMPEGRPFPSKYFPRPGAQLRITFGEPIPPSVILAALDSSRLELPTQPPHIYLDSPSLRIDCIDKFNSHLITTATVRANVTSVLHDYVEALGHQISGNLLGEPPSSKSSSN
ncbi:hypothetical protein D9619_001050 [Psilocybe cf. subviscida]|uniref:Tafazzin family protein n=1 Tax=Psilocybe cf. subviscida TaxID=2480587 RepID=A0A8H5BGG6_9AGAR|nr:hypothetical protein D9619_001050 [Psilocybe cf. subviscida]